MKYLVLYVPTATESAYRGIGRREPGYVDEVPESHPVNQAFLWYVQERYDFDAARDVSRVSGLVHLYRQLEYPQFFEVVGVVRASEGIEGLPGELLGFDVSDHYASLLFWGLDFSIYCFDRLGKDDPYWNVKPVVDLLSEHFRTFLNRFGLFDDAETAMQYLDCVKAIEYYRPSLFIESGVTMEVLALIHQPVDT